MALTASLDVLKVIAEGKGPRELRVRAFNRLGQTQPIDPLWNPAGYMRNVVERVRVHVS